MTEREQHSLLSACSGQPVTLLQVAHRTDKDADNALALALFELKRQYLLEHDGMFWSMTTEGTLRLQELTRKIGINNLKTKSV